MSGAFRIRELALTGFRSYATLRRALDGRPVVLVGANGAGKTNLLEALSLLSPGRGLRGASGEDLLGAGRPRWRIEAHAETPGGLAEIATEGAAAGGRRVEIDGKAATQMALADAVALLWLTPAMDRLWTDAPAERRRFLDRAAMSLVPGHAEAAIRYDRALRERNRMIRDGVADPAWYSAVERAMGESGARVAQGRRRAVTLLAAAQQAEGPFPAATLALESEAPDDADGLATALAEGRRRDIAAGRTLSGPHRDDLGAIYGAKGVPARLCSTGEQKALVLALALANARAVAQAAGAAPVLLLDEVAAHLDEGRREALFEAVLALGGQAWMTGTDPGLFARLGHRAQWLAIREAGGASEVAASSPDAAGA